MLSRRSLGGSMTVVGDIAQATGAWAHNDWDEILRHLPDRRPSRRAELTVGYRIPASLMEPAARVLAYAAPGLRPPEAVRSVGDPPRIVHSSSTVGLGGDLVDAVRDELAQVGAGNLAIVAPMSWVDHLDAVLGAAGLDHGRAPRDGLEHQVTLVPIRYAKGLELDAVVVVEPNAIVEEEAQGLRALYVALTRATKRVTILHADALPTPLRD
jgi:DNA helicase IV